MSKSNYHWNCTEFRVLEFKDPQDKSQTINGFYIRGEVDKGSKLQSLLAKANNPNSDINLVLFFNNEADRQAFKEAEALIMKEGFTAKKFLVPVEPNMYYHRFWQTEQEGHHQYGELVTGADGTPILYRDIEVSMLTDDDGTPSRSPIAEAERWFRRALSSGQIQLADSDSSQGPPMLVEPPKAIDAAALKAEFDASLAKLAQATGMAITPEMRGAQWTEFLKKRNLTPDQVQ